MGKLLKIKFWLKKDGFELQKSNECLRNFVEEIDDGGTNLLDFINGDTCIDIIDKIKTKYNLNEYNEIMHENYQYFLDTNNNELNLVCILDNNENLEEMKFDENMFYRDLLKSISGIILDHEEFSDSDSYIRKHELDITKYCYMIKSIELEDFEV